jgi:ubiquinone/menaquinone biosynthesis C-methylase UbiE
MTRNPFFGRVAENYDSWYSTPAARYAEAVEDRFLFEALHGISGSMLEVGSGTGNYLAKLHDFDFRCGVDASADMLKISCGKTPVPVVNGKAEALPFKDNSFDVVVAITALEFFEGLESGLYEISRVANKHVVLAFLSKPSLLHMTRLIKRLFSQNEFTFYRPLKPGWVAHYFVEELGGFKVESIRSTLLLFPIFHRWLKSYLRALDLTFSKSRIGSFSVIKLIKTER